MRRQYLISDFNQKLTLTKTKISTNPNNGNIVKQTVPDFTVWVKPQNRTMNQQYQLVGTRFEDSITLVARHSRKLENHTTCQYQGEDYKIIDFQPDDSSHSYANYDFITIQKVKK